MVAATFDCLVPKFHRVFFCPGNHDLWTSPPEHNQVSRAVSGRAPTGAAGDHGIAKMQNRREISASAYDDRSHDLHPHR
jgi:hypothetical protein